MDISLPPSSDPNGNSIPITCRVPPQYQHAMRELIDSDELNLPFESQSDFMRASIHRLIIGLQEDAERGKGVGPALIGVIKRWERRVFNTRIHRNLVETALDVNQAIADYLEAGDNARLRKELEGVCGDLLELDDNFWQRKALEELFEMDAIQEAVEELEDSGGVEVGKRTQEALQLWRDIAGQEG